jgi:hypothetical protein
VKNDYGTKLEARALNGLEEPLKKKMKFTLVINLSSSSGNR